MRINQNIAALNAWRNLTVTGSAMDKSLERLSSGYRINRAADDAAGLAISEKMRSQIKGLQSASANAQNGISLIQTAEGALTEVHSILQRMRELAVQAANDTNTDADRDELQKEVEKLRDEIDRIGGDTEFNTKKLLDGSLTEATTAQGTVLKSVTLENGADAAAVSATTFYSLTDANSNSFGFASATNVSLLINGYNGTTFKSEAITVNGSTTVGSLLSEIVSVLSAATVTIASGRITITGQDGTAKALYNVKLTASGKTLFNDKMSSFEETQTAQDTKTDASLTMQIGANSGQTTAVGISDMRADALGIKSVDVSTKQGATNAIAMIDRAITTVSGQRSNLGALQNRLEHTIQNLGVAVENMSAAESRIRDVDMALEMTTFTRAQILTQAGTAMLAQANQKTQSVLQLLR